LRPLLPAFLAVTLVPACGLAWLGWRLLEQDRALEAQRWRERRERAADSLVNALEQRLTGVERQLAESSSAPSLAQAEGAVVVEFAGRGIAARPKNRLVYYPWLPAGPAPPDQVFAAGEEQEFRQANHVKADAIYRELARSGDGAVRAGAQLRLARNLRKMGQAEAALAAFEQLQSFEDVSLNGTPAGLVARRARCALLAELKRPEPLRREAAALCADLGRARWKLTRAAYQIHMQDAREWAGVDAKPDLEPEMLAAAVERLWEMWRSQPYLARNGHQAEGGVTLVWTQAGDRLRALAATPGYVEREWLAPLTGAMTGFRVKLSDGAERRANGHVTQRAASESGLPWAVVVGVAEPGAELQELAGRRRLLLTGLVLILVLVLAGSYFIGRAVAREMAVARLQTDFVAAVSHEFRTPLTSLRQFTEILADRRVSEERRDSYYQALARATQRLHRLVEGLLDFGRMEAGASVFRFAELDAAGLVGEVVGEFHAEAEGRGYSVELRIDGGGGTVSADRESITRAIWNLLDNAVKYSPVNKTVWVDVERGDGRLAIRVRDRGLGVTPEERKEIFRKFVRGSSSKQVEGKGTGIGLAMVHHIVEAHGGELRLESRPGEGSTFSILLPVRS
jgi:signal transduction histidine kinase